MTSQASAARGTDTLATPASSADRCDEPLESAAHRRLFRLGWVLRIERQVVTWLVASCWRMFFLIFPVAVIGNASRTFTTGTL
jgi:hypothetical protein